MSPADNSPDCRLSAETISDRYVIAEEPGVSRVRAIRYLSSTVALVVTMRSLPVSYTHLDVYKRQGPLSTDERQAFIQASPMLATYGTTVDRESAYEILKGKPTSNQAAPGAIPAPPAGNSAPDVNDWGNHNNQPTQTRPAPAPEARQSDPAPQENSGGGFFGSLGDMFGGTTGPRGGHREGVLESAAKSAARGVAGTVGREVGRQILRGVLGSILGGRR